MRLQERIGANKVAICIPHWGEVTLEWAHYMYSHALSKEPDFKKRIVTSAGILNLDTERNVLVQRALEDKETTHILFIDSDCVLEEYNLNDAIRILLDTNLPIVSGLYRLKQEGHPYAMYKKQGEDYINIEKWSAGNTIICDAVGFGFVMIQRKVFEDVPAPWFVWNIAGIGEDWYACEKFGKFGYKVHVLLDIKLSHIGMFVLKSNGQFTGFRV